MNPHTKWIYGLGPRPEPTPRFKKIPGKYRIRVFTNKFGGIYTFIRFIDEPCGRLFYDRGNFHYEFPYIKTYGEAKKYIKQWGHVFW